LRQRTDQSTTSNEEIDVSFKQSNPTKIGKQELANKSWQTTAGNSIKNYRAASEAYEFAWCLSKLCAKLV
jgi:hypothetical protein